MPADNRSTSLQTHSLTLRFKSQTGALIDPEDVIFNVITDSDTVFAIFQRLSALSSPSLALPTRPSIESLPDVPVIDGEAVTVRAVTPETARQERATLRTFRISENATIRLLHQHATRHLNLVPNLDNSAFINECNCSFARKLSDHQSSPSTTSTFVIHDKSATESLQLTLPTKAALDQTLQELFGADITSQKRLHYFGGEEHADGQYTRLSIIAIC